LLVIEQVIEGGLKFDVQLAEANKAGRE